MRSIIHLHGFASSPNSSKAAFFRQHFSEYGISLRVPDLNLPSFEELTLTAQINRAAQEIASCPPGPVYLIGSSLGGAVALHCLDRHPAAAERVHKAVLLAPALDFLQNRQRQLGEEGLRRWQESGWLTVDHYGYGEPRRVHYGLMDDLSTYDSFTVRVSTPLLILHGRGDASVDPAGSERFAAQYPNVRLELLDTDHAMLDALPVLWKHIADFFELEP